MSRSTTYQAFFDELEKIALSSEDVPAETPITTSTAELVAAMQPGDIIATKLTKAPLWSNPKRTEWFQRIKGAPKDLAKWTHLGVYVGDGKLRHIYPPFKQDGRLGLASDSLLRDQSIRKLERIGREFLVMRPQTSDEIKQEAVHRSEEIKGTTTYNTLDMLRAGFWSGEGEKGEAKKMSPDEMKKAICTAVPAYAYPTFDFGHGKSIKTLMPSDVLVHRKLTPIIAYSDE
jgi:hypothetical protein